MAKQDQEVVKEVAPAVEPETAKAPVEAPAAKPVKATKVVVPEIAITSKYTYTPEQGYLLVGLPDNLGYVYYGEITRGKTTETGHTTVVISESVEDGVRYVTTRTEKLKVTSDATQGVSV